MQILLDQTIDTDYGQLDLAWSEQHGLDGELDTFFRGQANGLVGAASSTGIYLNLARRRGGSAVRIELHDSAPDLDDQWEDVVEVSARVPVGASAGWTTWAGEHGGPLAVPPGDYRIRVSARGRDAAADDGEFAEGLVDFYLVELWPAEPQPDTIVRTTSENAREFHDAWGTAR